MAQNQKEEAKAPEVKLKGPSKPMIFISHDSRDAELAEAFSVLLRAVSSNMLRAFRSSDKIGTEGIPYGERWYDRLMSALDESSDVVCLLTQRSIGRPWILYEAGVARAKLGTRVLGVSLGISLKNVGTGPFYEFQNCDDSEESLMGLMVQLAQRVPGMNPESDVVRSLVQKFKQDADRILSALAGPEKEVEEEGPSGAAVARLFEEMKGMYRDLPSRLEELLAAGFSEFRRRRIRRLHPMLLDEMPRMCGPGAAPLALLVFGSLVRDDAPWLHEVAIEAYRALTHGTQRAMEGVMRTLEQLRQFEMHPRFLDEIGLTATRDAHMLMLEGPRFLEHLIRRCLQARQERESSQS